MTESPAPGWYPDPMASEGQGGQLRWWVGTQWTGHVHAWSAAPTRRQVPRLFVSSAILGLVLIAVAALAAVLGGTGSSLDVVGDDGATAQVDQLGGTALPDLPSQLPEQAAWSADLTEVLQDAELHDIDAIGDVVYVTMVDDDFEQPDPPRIAAFDATSGEWLDERELEGDGGEVIVEDGEASVRLSAGQAVNRAVQDPTSALTVKTTDLERQWSRTYEGRGPSTRLLPGAQLLIRSPDDERDEIVELASEAPIHDLAGSLVSRSASYMVVADEDDRLAVLDADGEERWAWQGTSSTDVVVSDGLVYEGDGSAVTAYDADSGEHQWRAQVTDSVRALQPLPGAGVLVRGPEDRFTAFDVDGEQRWEEPLEGTLQLQRYDGALQLLRIDDGGSGSNLELERIDAETAEREQPTYRDRDGVVEPGGRPGLTLAGNGLLVTSDRGRIAIAYDEFEELWTLPDDVAGSPGAVTVVPGGIVTVREDEDGNQVLEGYR